MPNITRKPNQCGIILRAFSPKPLKFIEETAQAHRTLRLLRSEIKTFSYIHSRISIDPNLQPNVTNVIVEDNGGVKITWSHAGCSQIFPFTTMVYYQSETSDMSVNGSTNWTLLTNTDSTFHVTHSILLYPNTTLKIKLNTRYVVNGEVIISDNSAVFNFPIPGKRFQRQIFCFSRVNSKI